MFDAEAKNNIEKKGNVKKKKSKAKRINFRYSSKHCLILCTNDVD